MNVDWQEKLTSVGANAAHDSADHLGEQAQHGLPMLAELSRLAVIDVTGEDAATFLQAQVCNDLTVLSASQAQINGYCSPKGRLLALFTVYAHLDGYRLILPDDVAPAFIKRLQMFVMRAQVSINIRTDLVCVGLVFDSGTGAVPAPLAQYIATLPDSIMSLDDNDSLQVLRWHDAPSERPDQPTQARYLFVGGQEELLPFWQNDQFSHAPWSYWRWGDINAGIPTVHASSAELFIPQMLNMQMINALSFKKGCYPGQEIVARMQYLGKLKKHMKHLRATGATQAPLPGEVLVTDTNNNAGQVVDAIVDEHGVNMLAVVNIETPVNELTIAGVALQEVALPYALALDPEKDT